MRIAVRAGQAHPLVFGAAAKGVDFARTAIAKWDRCGHSDTDQSRPPQIHRTASRWGSSGRDEPAGCSGDWRLLGCSLVAYAKPSVKQLYGTPAILPFPIRAYLTAGRGTLSAVARASPPALSESRRLSGVRLRRICTVRCRVRRPTANRCGRRPATRTTSVAS